MPSFSPVLIAFEVLAYLAIAMLVASVISAVYVPHAKWSDRDFLAGLSLIAGFVWPVGLVIFGLIEGTRYSQRVVLHGGRIISAARYKDKLKAARIKMMEDDNKRVAGTSKAVTLRYDYEACANCWGAGCGDCNDTGIKRRLLG